MCSLHDGLPCVGGRAEAALADERAALDERLTLAQAVGFWARLDGATAATGMEAMGIAPLASVPVRMLSTGQRKRAVLARVVASGSPLWLREEPVNGIDTEGAGPLMAAMIADRAHGGADIGASQQPPGTDSRM